MTKRPRNKPWFIRVRGSYLPNSWQGWLTYVPFLAYTIGALVFVLTCNFTFWHGLFMLIPNWVTAAVVMTWIASRKT